MYYHNEYCFTQFYSTSLQERHTIVLLLHVKMFLTMVQLLGSHDFIFQWGITVLPVGMITGIVICMGNLQVFLGYPYPYPLKPVPVAAGMGFHGFTHSSYRGLWICRGPR